jgi:hypothetical protein
MVRHITFAALVVVLLAACGETPTVDPFDLPSEPTHEDLISAAKAAGFADCEPPDDHGMTICRTAPPSDSYDTQGLEIVDGNEGLAKSEYERTCADNGPEQQAWDVWYGGSDWALLVTAEFVDAKDVRGISGKLGDPRKCGN